jgi:hypothetical protein
MKTKSHYGGLLQMLLCMVAIAAMLALFTHSSAQAQTDPPAALTLDATSGNIVTDTVALTPPAPWYADGAVIGGIIAALTSIFAIWSNKQMRTAEKISRSLVEAIEVASRIPAVATKEKEIKQSINATVTRLGVQPLVHRIVKDVTL